MMTLMERITPVVKLNLGFNVKSNLWDLGMHAHMLNAI